MKIYAPVKDFNGIRNNVRFVNGIGETDNPALIPWFESRGYSVEKCTNMDENSIEKCAILHENNIEKSDEPDFEEMTPIELREWAKANGFGGVIKNTRSKEKLLELIRG